MNSGGYRVGDHVIVVSDTSAAPLGARGYIQAVDGDRLWVLPPGRMIPYGADPRSYCMWLYAHEVALIER